MNKILNLLSESQLSLLRSHFNYVCNFMPRSSNDPEDTPGYNTHQVYAEPITENILHYVHPVIEKEYGKELCPTYSFWRRYYKGQTCKAHTDRPACEVSITLNIGGTPRSDWSIFVEDKEYSLSEGQGVLYKGCDQEHWRDPLPYENHTQIFLHYIEKNGKFYPTEKYDRRQGLYSAPSER